MNAKSRAYAKTERWKITVALAAHKRRQILKNSSDKTIDIDFINNLIIIQKWECKWCKVKLLKNGKKNYHIDHIIPISKWWYHTAKNIQLLCPTCNHIKYDKVLEDTFFKW
jgi:5-methylcytosine-specific restriction endonuclease McrA